MKKICLIIALLTSFFCSSQNDSINKFIAKWKLVGEYDTKGKQLNVEINNEFSKQDFFMILELNGSYTHDIRKSKRKSTKKRQATLIKAKGFWTYDPENQKIIFQKLLNKNDLKIVSQEFRQKINGIQYLTPVDYSIYLIDNKNLILYDAFHRVYSVYEK